MMSKVTRAVVETSRPAYLSTCTSAQRNPGGCLPVSSVVFVGRCRSRLHSPCLGFAQMWVAREINAQGHLQEPTREQAYPAFLTAGRQRGADREQKPPGCVEGSRTQASQAGSGLTLLRALILL